MISVTVCDIYSTLSKRRWNALQDQIKPGM